jgi:hypothetical protein
VRVAPEHRKAELAAFDSLPAAIRAALREGAGMAPSNARKLLDDGASEVDVLAAIAESREGVPAGEDGPDALWEDE